MSVTLGIDCKLFINGNEIKNVRNVTLSVEKGEADVTHRGANGWRLTIGTLKEANVEWEMIWDPAETGFGVVQTAFFATTPAEKLVDMRVEDDQGNGLTGKFEIMKFSRQEPIDGPATVSVTAKPTYNSDAGQLDAPEWAQT